MRTLISITILAAISFPAYAAIATVPEPETLSLLAIGVVGLALARRRKNK